MPPLIQPALTPDKMVRTGSPKEGNYLSEAGGTLEKSLKIKKSFEKYLSSFCSNMFVQIFFWAKNRLWR